MKLFIYILILLPSFLFAQLSPKREFVLTGKVKNLDNGYIYFVTYDNNDKRFLDSSILENGNFKYKGQLNGYLYKFFIKLNPNNTYNNDSLNNVRIPIENSNMQLNLELGKFSKYELTGCKSCQIVKTFDSLNMVRHNISLAHDSILDDPSVYLAVKRNIEIADSIERIDYLKKWLAYCQANPNGNATPYILNEIARPSTLKKTKLIYSKFGVVQKSSYYGFKLKNEIKQIENDIIVEKLSGTKLLNTSAYKFKALDYFNQSIDLGETYKKGFTILDFWASWCGPCRKSHPAFINLFNKYSKANLNVIGISIDDKIEDWKKAIVKDLITVWPNILDKNSNNGVNLKEKFNIHYYPTKLLINKKGIIIGIYIGEDFSKLENKLKEIYNY
jgi:thiol-disulfide isomerase/thioredoxin